MKTKAQYREHEDWALEVLRDYLLENSNYTTEMREKVKQAKTFGDLVNVIYYDTNVGFNDISMLLCIINDAMEAQE